MMTIAAVSQKGGSGRTTTLMNLAVMFDGKVLVIDLDPQQTASEWGALRGDRAPDVLVSKADLLPQEIAAAEREGYDLVLIDTPPLAEREAAKAAAAAGLVMLPCRPCAVDLRSLRTSLAMVKALDRPAVVVITQAPVQRKSRVTAEAIDAITGMGGTVSDAIIRNRVAFQHSQNDGGVAAEFEPAGPAAAEIAYLLTDLRKRYRVNKRA